MRQRIKSRQEPYRVSRSAFPRSSSILMPYAVKNRYQRTELMEHPTEIRIKYCPGTSPSRIKMRNLDNLFLLSTVSMCCYRKMHGY